MDEMVEPGHEGLVGEQPPAAVEHRRDEELDQQADVVQLQPVVEASLPVAVGAEPIQSPEPTDPAEEIGQLHLHLVEPDAGLASMPESAEAATDAPSDAFEDPALLAVLASLEGEQEAVPTPSATPGTEHDGVTAAVSEQPSVAPVPEAVAVPAPDASAPDVAPAVECVPYRVSRIPFALYGAVWAAFAAAVYLLFGSSGGTGNVLGSLEYRIMVYAGIAVAALGPVLAIGVTIAALRGGSGSDRFELIARVFVITAGLTLFGVVAWWAALFAVDISRTGLLS